MRKHCRLLLSFLPFLPNGRSNAGRSRFDCRGQRRVSDLKTQIAKRRGGRRPAYGSTIRQGGSSPWRRPVKQQHSSAKDSMAQAEGSAWNLYSC